MGNQTLQYDSSRTRFLHALLKSGTIEKELRKPMNELFANFVLHPLATTSGMVKRETSFTSQCTPQEIMSKIEEACGPLGFNVRKQNYKMKLKGDKTGRKGHLSVATEVFEVAPSLHMVELCKTGGDTLEFHNV